MLAASYLNPIASFIIYRFLYELPKHFVYLIIKSGLYLCIWHGPSGIGRGAQFNMSNYIYIDLYIVNINSTN